MSSSEDDEERAQADFERAQALRREKRTWAKRLRAWAKTPDTANAHELLAICAFYASLPEDDRDLHVYDTFTNYGAHIPASEMQYILTWYHTDPAKREQLNALLCVYSCDPWDRFDPTAPGPERYLVKNWHQFSSEQQAVIIEHGKLSAADGWMQLYGGGIHNGNGTVPFRGMSWEFLKAFDALVRKHAPSSEAPME